jgi:hypothetical protein
MMEHVSQAAAVHSTPALAFATGQRIPPAMVAPMPTLGGPMPPPQGPAGPQQAGPAPRQQPPAPGRAKVPGSAPDGDMPMMPINPATGNRADAGAGEIQ